MSKILIIYFPCIEGVVENGNPKGGCVVETIVWMKSLHELGHDIYLAKYSNDERVFSDDYKWINPITLYHPNKFRKTLVWFSYRLPSIFFALEKKQFDFVYLAMPHWTYFFTAFLCKMTNTKQVIRIANDKNVDRSLANDNNYLIGLLNEKSLKASDFVVAQNKFQFDILKNDYKIKNLIKLSNPIVLNQSYLMPKMEMAGYMAWLANFRHQKNLKLLFEVASVLPNEYFKIAGQPLIPMDEETALYMEKLKSLKNVKFVGVVPNSEVLEFLGNAKFLLSTSRYEGFSNTFLESMVAGTPILTTKSVNPDGIIDEFGLGHLYRDAADLKSIMDKVTVDDYLMKSRNVIKYVRAHHDHLALGEKLVKFLHENS